MFSFAGFFLDATLLAALAIAGQPNRPIEEEAFLTSHAKLATDNANLLTFLRVRSGQTEPARVERLIEQLGSSSFEERDAASRTLAVLGPAALPGLRKAIADRDAEIARRARACLDTVEKSINDDWSLPVVRILAARKPTKAFDSFLAFLPYTADPDVEEEIYYALDRFVQPAPRCPQL
jgi:hypothetical protein